MKLEPFTNWDDVPLVCEIEEAARVLRRSVKSIYRELQAGTMVPPPLPRAGKTTPFKWTKKALQEHLEGAETSAPGYLRHDAPGARRRRNHFGKGKQAALAAAAVQRAS